MDRLTSRTEDGKAALNPGVGVWELVNRLADFEDREEKGLIFSKEQITKVLNEVCNIHPYKIPGDFDTYSEYNEGWTDATNLIEGRLQLYE